MWRNDSDEKKKKPTFFQSRGTPRDRPYVTIILLTNAAVARHVVLVDFRNAFRYGFRPGVKTLGNLFATKKRKKTVRKNTNIRRLFRKFAVYSTILRTTNLCRRISVGIVFDSVNVRRPSSTDINLIPRYSLPSSSPLTTAAHPEALRNSFVLDTDNIEKKFFSSAPSVWFCCE